MAVLDAGQSRVWTQSAIFVAIGSCDYVWQPGKERIMVSRRRLGCVAIALGLIVGLGSTPHAAISTNPVAFIDNLANRTLKILEQHLPAPEREQRFKALLLENFDMPRISRFVLGRYWLTGTAQEKEEFQKLLPDYVAQSYSNRFANYTGETLKVTGSRLAGQDTTVVRSRIDSTSGGPPVNVEWRVVQAGSDFRIVDVSVDGVSLVLTHRDEFAAVVEREGGGVSTLNRLLREKVANVAALSSARSRTLAL
jgi:phospholipid transport system substrate-binding protein